MTDTSITVICHTVSLTVLSTVEKILIDTETDKCVFSTVPLKF